MVDRHPDIQGITEQLKAGGSRVVFFVGAGLSRDLGFPLWDELLLEVINYGVLVVNTAENR